MLVCNLSDDGCSRSRSFPSEDELAVDLKMSEEVLLSGCANKYGCLKKLWNREDQVSIL